MAQFDPHDPQHETGDDATAVATPIATERAGIKLPVLVLVGRPNVGKSTLFNRLTRTREALVAPVPGVTRDRREAVVQREGLHFRLVDTGGMTFDKAAVFGPEVDGQIRAALAEAALAWLIVDVADGLNPYDAELARILQSSGRPWMVLANKTEGPLRQGRLGEFYGLGAPLVVGVSAMQGFGVVEALEKAAERAPALRREASLPVAVPAPVHPTPVEGEPAVAGALPTDMPIPEGAPEADTATEDESFDSIRVAFVGRPNVGKSSLLNAILGEPRFIVSDIPGTTREAIDVHVTVEGERFMLVDTAGLRRKARTVQYLDKLSAVNTLTALDRAEVAVLVVDALEGAVDQDAHIAGYILDRGRACVLALNKWDTVRGGAIPAGAEARTGIQEPQAIQENIEHALRFMHHAEAVRVSALERTGLRHLFRAIRTAHRQFTRSVTTADLNRVIQIVTRHTPPPARGRSPTKVHYGVQIGVRPPTFRLFTNHPEQVRQEYTRFMEQQLRYHLGFEGTPLRIEWRGKDSAKDSGKDGEGEEGGGRSKATGAASRSEAAKPTQSRRQRARAKEALGVSQPRPQREKLPKTPDDKRKNSGRKRNAGKSSRRPTKPAMGKRHGGRKPR